MITFLNESDQVSVPSWVVDLDSFRRWTDTDEFPDNGRIWFLKGEVWVDMSKEQIFTHVQVKTKVAIVVGGLVETEQLGLFLTDGVLLSSFEADVGGNPDGVFLSHETLRSDRVRLIEGKDGGAVELQGSPDMVLEVVSDSSVQKDTVFLREAYWEAGVREYWLLDARKDPIKFDILRHTAKGYVATRKSAGWVKSGVFGKSFRLTRKADVLGHPAFTLAMK